MSRIAPEGLPTECSSLTHRDRIDDQTIVSSRATRCSFVFGQQVIDLDSWNIGKFMAASLAKRFLEFPGDSSETPSTARLNVDVD